MSIIVLQYTIADNFPVDPNWNTVTDSAIYAGQLVGLTSQAGTYAVSSPINSGGTLPPYTPSDTTLTGIGAGYVAPANTTTILPLGIAGDSIADSYKTTAWSAQLVISPTGRTRWTQDRIDNYFDETAASGQMTVYTTGGRFGTDQYVAGLTYNPGATLYSTAAGLFTTAVAGRSVGYVLTPPGGWESGVPGADAVNGLANINGSMAMGPYLFVQLSI